MRRIANAIIVIASMMGGLFVLYVDHITDWYVIGFMIVAFMSWSIVASSGDDT